MQPVEVFRFVASRAPRPRRPQLDLTQFVAATPFFRRLMDDLRSPNPRASVFTAVDDFLSGDEFNADPGRVEMFRLLEELHASLRRDAPLNAGEARARVAAVFGADARALLADTAFVRALGTARDAVLALKLRSEGRPGLLGRYSRIVQAGEFVRRLATAPDQIEFGRLSSSLLLPFRLPPEFGVLRPGGETGEEPAALVTPPSGSVATVARMATLERAIAELSEGAGELERRTVGADASERLVLSEAATRRLSAPTRAFLAEEEIQPSTTSYTAVLDGLESRRSALMTELPAETDDDDEPLRVVLGRLVLPSATGAPALPLDPGFLDPSTVPPTTIGPLTPTSVGSLLIVRQQIKRYEAGEISHTQNVLRSEHLSRSTRRLRRTEESFLVEEERSTQEERTHQTTERFELQSEIKNTLESARQFNVGATVSAGYGPFVQVEASTGFETSTSSQQAQSTASEFAREMTERTASRITQRVRTEQTRATLEEFEETNTQGFDNTNGDSHAIGVYQWLDRIYEMQVYDCGVRVLFEFTVLEPAAMYLNALQAQLAKPEGLKAPKKLTIKPNQITASNYSTFVSRYRAESVQAPPAVRITIAKSFAHSSPDGTPIEHSSEVMLTVPEGYRAVEATAAIKIDEPGGPALPGSSGQSNRVDILVANQRLFRFQRDGENDQTDLNDVLDHPEGDLPAAVSAVNVVSYAATLTVECVRTTRKYEQWQLATYEAIARAFLARQQEHEEKLATLASQQGAVPQGRNPTLNRIIERNEMKRLAITMLTGQRFKSTSVPLSPQAAEFDFQRMLRSGRYAHFWETAIEWRNLDYEFLPYYWARQSTWGRLLTEDADPLHAQFISAGAATVRLAVTPGFEPAILHFLETGEIWNGGELPEVTREEFIGFLDEVDARRLEPVDPNAPVPLGGFAPDEIPFGEPWEVKLPTTLVRLRPDDSLPRWERGPDGQWHAVEE